MALRLIPILVLLALPAVARAELPVTLTDTGYVTPCAEQDNVLVAMTAPQARRFEVRARHPAYHAGVEEHSSAADFTNCVFPDEPIWDFDLQSHVLFEDEAVRLQGHRLSKSWRPELVDVSVGERTWPGLHLLQLVAKRAEGEVEILVLYPSDGYWRPKPLPPEGHADSPYGASFVVGPVEVDRRPLVKLSAVAFDPERLAFRLEFVRGGGGEVRVVSAGIDELRLAVTLDGPVADGPVAMLSSMYVAEDNADIGRMRVRPEGGAFWEVAPVLGFAPLTGAEVAFERVVPSRHNTLAPDVIFGPFRAEGD